MAAIVGQRAAIDRSDCVAPQTVASHGKAHKMKIIVPHLPVGKAEPSAAPALIFNFIPIQFQFNFNLKHLLNSIKINVNLLKNIFNV
jgi:hypothetical protein